MTTLLAVPTASLLRLMEEDADPKQVSAGWLYPLVVFTLMAVLVLLWLSMRKQLKKIRFEESDQPTDADEDNPPV